MHTTLRVTIKEWQAALNADMKRPGEESPTVRSTQAQRSGAFVTGDRQNARFASCARLIQVHSVTSRSVGGELVVGAMAASVLCAEP
jgi:hypothetical protein